jgi:hypothetical protein
MDDTMEQIGFAIDLVTLEAKEIEAYAAITRADTTMEEYTSLIGQLETQNVDNLARLFMTLVRPGTPLTEAQAKETLGNILKKWKEDFRSAVIHWVLRNQRGQIAEAVRVQKIEIDEIENDPWEGCEGDWPSDVDEDGSEEGESGVAG